MFSEEVDKKEMDDVEEKIVEERLEFIDEKIAHKMILEEFLSITINFFLFSEIDEESKEDIKEER